MFRIYRVETWCTRTGLFIFTPIRLTNVDRIAYKCMYSMHICLDGVHQGPDATILVCVLVNFSSIGLYRRLSLSLSLSLSLFLSLSFLL